MSSMSPTLHVFSKREAKEKLKKQSKILPIIWIGLIADKPNARFVGKIFPMFPITKVHCGESDDRDRGKKAEKGTTTGAVQGSIKTTNSWIFWKHYWIIKLIDEILVLIFYKTATLPLLV